MKRCFIILLMFALLLSLTSCGENEGPELVPLPLPDKSLKECDWTLVVDDTITKEVNGVKIKHHLLLEATKKGGTDSYGVYEGTAILSSSADLGELSSGAFQVLGNTGGTGRDEAVKFEIDYYNQQIFSSNGELMELVEHDGMALGTFNMKGMGYMDMSMVPTSERNSVNSEFNEEINSTVPLRFRMHIDGGQVSIEIPAISYNRFKGMVTGTPIN
jgi:predicted small lipoprotein YifL